MAMEACALRKDVADGLFRSIDHYGQNQSDGAYAAAPRVFELKAMVGVKYACTPRTCNRVNPRERGRETCRS